MTRLWLPFFPPPLILGLLALGLGTAATAYLRTRRRGPATAIVLLLLRLSALAILGTALFGPARQPPPHQAPRQPRIDFWIDTSASMAVDDMDGLTRLDFIKTHWLSPSIRHDIERSGVTLRAYTFDESYRELLLNPDEISALRADGNATHIVRNLLRGLTASPHNAPGMVVLFSDGIDSTNAHPAPLIAHARERRIPLHTVTLGGPRLEPDLALVARPLQDTLIAGEPGSIQVQIFQSNVANQTVTLHIDDGSTPRSQQLTFRGEPYLSFDLPVRHEDPGTYVYTFRVDPLPREVEHRNNHQTLYLNVTPQRFRVLLLEGEPGWDSKFLAHALRNDPRMELLQISQISPTRREVLSTRLSEIDPVFPETRAQLAAFDAIILGRSPHRIADEPWFDHLEDFVRDQGGGLLWARGPPQAIGLPTHLAERLAPLSPFASVRDLLPEPRLELTPAGRHHPAFEWGEFGNPDTLLPQLPSLLRGIRGTPRTAASALLHFDAPGNPPALLSMPAGNGRILLFAGEGFWQWRLLPPELEDLGETYDLIWTALLRQLVTGEFAPGQEIDLRISDVNVQAGTPLHISVSRRLPASVDQQQVLLFDTQGQPTTLTATDTTGRRTRFETEFLPQTPGQYRVELHTPDAQPPILTRRFNVYDIDTERLTTAARPEWMRLLSRETGGTVLDPRQPGHLPEAITRDLLSLEIPRPPILIWSRGSLMTLLLSLLGIEWLLRKSKGWI